MKKMLEYLREHRRDGVIVLIDDISRLARDIRAHLKLCDDIARVGARLESPDHAILREPRSRASSLKAELVRVERQVNQFLDCIVEAETPAVRKAYEARIGKLEAEKLELSEKIANCGKPLRSFDESVRTALDGRKPV
jgi:DNA invertase Pin-like site-specific DNA recombinase